MQNKWTIYSFLGIMIAALITLAVLQYHWLGSVSDAEKKRLETERLFSKVNLVKEALYKCNYDEYYESRSEDFLGSITEQVRDRGNLSPKQKLALNKMYKRFNKKIEKKT